MRAFLQRFAWFLAIQLLVATAVLWSYRRQNPAKESYLAASIDKQSLVATQASPRLILIGGSSLAFGVDSARIAAACGRKPVNMGLNGALGLKFMLAQVEPFVRPGDWILIAPEYQQFARTSARSEMLANILEIDPGNARLLGGAEWSELFDRGFIQRFGRMARAVIGRPSHVLRRESTERTRTVYRRGAFNANGDVVAHLTAKAKRISAAEFQFRYREDLARRTIAQLNQFAAMAQARGARVWFSHPPLPREVFAANCEELLRLETTLKAGLAFPRLDEAEELLFPLDHFFDTWYHLGAPGVEERTRLLAARMGQQAIIATREATRRP